MRKCVGLIPVARLNAKVKLEGEAKEKVEGYQELVDEYGFPTWAEVEAARGDEAAKAQQIEQITVLTGRRTFEVADGPDAEDVMRDETRRSRRC